MNIHMYLPEAAYPGRFVVTEENGRVILLTTEATPLWSRCITSPAGDTVLLKVRYTSRAGESFIFSDITGIRGAYHLRRYEAVVNYHMLNERREMQYNRLEGTVRLTRRGKPIATARILPEYASYFFADIIDPSELLFVSGSLLAVSKELSTSRI